MLTIYTGREDIDKQGYLFERIRSQDLSAGRKQPIFLVVPDQFTLETERSAFEYMQVSAFFNPIVLSLSRLAGKVLAETGESTEHIDLYGNYMLLARMLYRSKDRLTLYRGLENSTGFIAQLSEAIMSLKSHLITPDTLASCADQAEQDGVGGLLLGKKLRDVASLYADYELALADGLPDNTDILRRFSEKIEGSTLLKNAILWIFGFDYFSPLHTEAIGKVAARASEVNIILTAERGNAFFALTNALTETLSKAADKAGAETRVISITRDAAERNIDCAYLPEDRKPAEIQHIEQTLFANTLQPYKAGSLRHDREDSLCRPDAAKTAHISSASPLRFIVAQSHYSEAEAAAQIIIRLIREDGLRYRDILVVCNDQERRAPMVQRVFGSYGIETFFDKRYYAGYSPVLAYITALPDIISRGRRAEDVLRWIGSGLTDIGEEDAEELENYAERYGLRGGAWKKRLTRGRDTYDEEDFSRLKDTVKYIGGMLDLFAKRFGSASGDAASAKTARARTEGLKRFLVEDARLPEKITAYADMLEAAGFLEYAARMHSVWNVVLQIFTQISGALGELVTSTEEYATILRVGFASVMRGVLPASSDAVTIGTMQRTRTGRIKAILVLGANDGELPMFAEDDGLLDDSEKETLEQLGITAFRREENLHEEEQLAIYKNLSKPTRLLCLSYTAFSADGKNDTRPSRIFDRLRALFPAIPLEKDSLVCESGGLSTMRPRPAYRDREDFSAYKMDTELLWSLIPPVLSPTSIEKYSRCPFAFLAERGLKLGELRKHAIDSRDLGDVYHEAIKRFGEEMNLRGGAPAYAKSAWNTASRADTDSLVENVFRDIENAVKTTHGHISDSGKPYPPRLSAESALLFDENDPVARYRLSRLRSITKDICYALTQRAKESGAERMIFEAEFGDGHAFEAVSAGDGALKIAGRIDRVDVLPGGRAKVLDYKSGSEKWNIANVKNGWQLQLMLYLKAIEKAYTPDGLAYFRIFEPHINLSDPKAPSTPEAIKDAVISEYRSDGVAACRADAESANKSSTGEKLLPKEDFDKLRAEVDERLSGIATRLANGEAPAAPKQKAGGESVTACTYCNFKSICNYETI